MYLDHFDLKMADKIKVNSGLNLENSLQRKIQQNQIRILHRRASNRNCLTSWRTEESTVQRSSDKRTKAWKVTQRRIGDQPGADAVLSTVVKDMSTPLVVRWTRRLNLPRAIRLSREAKSPCYSRCSNRLNFICERLWCFSWILVIESGISPSERS